MRRCLRGGNQVAHRFRLRQIKFPIEKGALRKLAGSRQTTTRRYQQFEYFLLDIQRTVTGYFHHVFARVGMWRAESRYQNFV